MNSTNITRDEAARRSAGLEVHSYRTSIDIRRADEADVPWAELHVVVDLEATIEHTFLDFVGGEVDVLRVNGADRSARYDGARIQVDLEPGANTVEVIGRAAYSRSGQGLHRFVDPLDGRTYLYTQFEPVDARRLYPCFDQPDLKATHHVTVLAPDGWTVRSNQPVIAVEVLDDGGLRHDFGPTPPLSTYLVCIAAGEWHEAGGAWTSPEGVGERLDVQLGLLCRQSLAPHLDADALLELTRQGMDFYHRTFGFAYPWGKYDQVFVPEYNLGAMENPGLVTFTEAYLPRSAATRAQYQGRANTVLHEMAHMWFGDLVTPAWWDDLWLKESFAEFMGAHASVAATAFTDAWVAFAGRRKAWAYEQDQLPSTHPIVADIGDIEAAKQNFDGITYAKGAAVLKQLVAHVGVDAFFAGARAYFRDHAYSSARLADLLRALQEASGRDLDAWSRAWLQTAGPDTLTPVLEVADGRVTRLAVQQESVDARDGGRVGRPHTLAVGLYRLAGDELVRGERFAVELDGTELTEVAEAVGAAAPDLVLLNDEDLTYAKIVLDEGSLQTALARVGGVVDPLARALVWSSLWNMTRDAMLPAGRYVEAVAAQGAGDPDVATLTDLLERATFTVHTYLPPARRDAAAADLAERLWERVVASEPGSDAQLALARAVASLSGRVPGMAGRLQGVLDGTVVLEGLDLGPDLRWMFQHALAATGHADESALDAELERDRSNDSVTARLGALAARPDTGVKQAVWDDLHTPGALPNDHVDAMVEGFMQPGQEHLVAGFGETYFATLDDVWRGHAIEIAQRLVRGLFPKGDGAADGAQVWLDGHPDAPRALRRLVVEGQDRARRAARAQEASA